jgi:hypothetical protein
MINPIPDNVAMKIARRAVSIAYFRAPKSSTPRKSHHGADNFQPIASAGKIGIGVPPEYGYMIALDKGYDPYVMYGLAGKTIPIRDASGNINFRTAYGSSAPGKRKVISRNAQGQIVETKIMWKNPGMKGMHFIEDALKQAAMEWKNSARSEEILDMIASTGAAGASFVETLNQMRF